MKRSMLTFYLATLLPLPLLVAAGVLGGYWTLAACMYLTTFVFLLDELIGYAAEDAAPGTEFPAGRGLSAFLGVIHIPVLFLAVATVSGATGQSALEQVGAFIAFGIWFGHVAYSNAHELIHRTNPTAFRLGALVYGTTFYGHHVTAHRFIHHTYVGSDRDPNTSRLGESFYRFAIRAWGRAFVEGFRIETDRLRRRGQSAQVWRHPYFGYFLINVGMLGSIFVLFSWSGIAAYLAISVYATAQILLADYVQHYGLQREEVAPGKLEPISVEHSWNAPHPISAALMLNAPRHSDHHAHPSKPFTTLELPDEADAPMLPASLPAMSSLALFPPLWRYVMDDRALAWRRAPAAPQNLAAE